MATTAQISVRTEFGPSIRITLPFQDQQNIVRGAMASLTHTLPDLDERTILNTPWPNFTRLRKNAIRRDLTAFARDNAEFLPDA